MDHGSLEDLDRGIRAAQAMAMDHGTPEVPGTDLVVRDTDLTGTTPCADRQPSANVAREADWQRQ
ncbi:hypothetical protein JCM10914A_32380 [Paenibacillus sp. JCM 10914]